MESQESRNKLKSLPKKKSFAAIGFAAFNFAVCSDVIAGDLWKRGRLLGRWHRRYFILLASGLLLSCKRSSSQQLRSIKVSVRLSSDSMIGHPTLFSEKSHDSLIIRIVTLDRSIELLASSQQQYSQWISAIEDLMRTLPTSRYLEPVPRLERSPSGLHVVQRLTSDNPGYREDTQIPASQLEARAMLGMAHNSVIEFDSWASSVFEAEQEPTTRSDLRGDMRDVIISSIRGCIESRAAVVVLDTISAHILSSVVTVGDMTDESVYLIESLEKMRQPQPDMDAIYFICPKYIGQSTSESSKNEGLPVSNESGHQSSHTRRRGVRRSVSLDNILTLGPSSMDRVFKDIESRKRMYAHVNVFWLDTGIDSEHIAQRLRRYTGIHKTGPVQLHMNFNLIQPSIVDMELPNALPHLFLEDPNPYRRPMLEAIVNKLVGLCITAHEYPWIRFQGGSPISGMLASMFQEEMDLYIRDQPKWWYHGISNISDRAILIIVDRTLDMGTPMIHDFSYEAAIRDLLHVDGSEVTLFTDPSQIDHSVFQLNESDSFWQKHRYDTVFEVVEKIKNKTEELGLSSVSQLQKGQTDIATMAQATREIGIYTQSTQEISKHATITQGCLQEMNLQLLRTVCLLEEELMTGVDSSGKILKPSQLIKRVKEMTSNAAIEEHIKLRLFCLLSISLGELTYEDRQMLFSAQSFLNRNIEPPKVPSFAQEHLLALQQLTAIGLKTALVKDKELLNMYREEARSHSVERGTRVIPEIVRTLNQLLHRNLDTTQFPYIIEPPLGVPVPPLSISPNHTVGQSAPHSVRTHAKSARHRSSSVQLLRGHKKCRVILCMAGGLSHCEVAAMRRLTREEEWADKAEIVLASTSLMSPSDFLHSLVQFNSMTY